MTCYRKILSIFVGVIIILINGFAYAQYDPRPYDHDGDDMLERCRSQGAVAVVDELLQDDMQGWKDVLEKIATGNTQWIEASACLAHGVFYSLRERSDYADASLAAAWARALLKNPEALLLRDEETSLTKICSLPRDFRGKTTEFADDFLAQALAALETVEEDHPQRRKKTCAFHLRLDHERFISLINEYKNGH